MKNDTVIWQAKDVMVFKLKDTDRFRQTFEPELVKDVCISIRIRNHNKNAADAEHRGVFLAEHISALLNKYPPVYAEF
ncbi:MAG: hypothetical protein ACD_84C00036G0001 [uncultured bacterium]|nr:MAG: hypothetical protein ACD_84C00036G0001 [uncultured bacterium]